MKSVLAVIIENGKFDSCSTVEDAKALTIKTLQSVKQSKDIKKMIYEITQLESLSRVQKYVFNAYFKFIGLGVIK